MEAKNPQIGIWKNEENTENGISTEKSMENDIQNSKTKETLNSETKETLNSKTQANMNSETQEIINSETKETQNSKTQDNLNSETQNSKTQENLNSETQANMNSETLNSEAKETQNSETQGSMSSETPVFSKRQRKKLQRRQRWLDTRTERRKIERQKVKLKIEARKSAGETCIRPRKLLKRSTMALSACKVRVAIDMSFDELMIERHLNQCVKQLSRCYAANRRLANPIQLYFTSLSGLSRDVIQRQIGYESWDVNIRSEAYSDIFNKSEVVYLTSESPNVIAGVSENNVYIIGGLVDHNKHKGLTLRLAEEKGIAHGRLPIDENVCMKTRKVLTIDCVFRILAGVAQGKTWREVLLDIIPQRKGAVAPGKEEEEEEEEEEEMKEERKEKRKEEEEEEEGE